MNEIPNYYPNFLKDKRESRTFNQIKRAYGKFQELLGSYLQTRTFIMGGAAPYLLMNKDSKRLHDDIDVICYLEDIPILRKRFKDTPYYKDSWDSLNYKKGGLDFGFTLIIDDVPIGIKPFFVLNNILMILFFVPYQKDFVQIQVNNVENLYDYFTKYKGADGKVYYMATLEFIKKSKDFFSLFNRHKDVVDSKFIEEIGINRNIYYRVLNWGVSIIQGSYHDIQINSKNKEM